MHITGNVLYKATFTYLLTYLLTYLRYRSILSDFILYRIKYIMHGHGIMSASLLGLDWTKLARRRSYRPKTRSSQLKSVYSIFAAVSRNVDEQRVRVISSIRKRFGIWVQQLKSKCG